MARKKWTPRNDITDNLVIFREKRKWQLAFRRYVLEQNISEAYAPYFGLDSKRFRKWIELQFSEDLSWENFGSGWQFVHLLPINYFDFRNPDDLRLCWNFINIRIESITPEKKNKERVDILGLKSYFELLYRSTGYSVCLKILEKIQHIESANIFPEPLLEDFLIENKNQLEQLNVLSGLEFTMLNEGISLEDIFLEREILRKFG